MTLRLRDLTLGHDRHPAIHHLNGVFAAGSLTAIVGPNGAGKTTLLKGLKGLLPVMNGRIEAEGIDRAAIAYLPQQSDLDQDFPISVMDVVLLGHWRRSGAFGRIGRAARLDAAAALAAVGLSGFERRPIGSLSGGQRQRVLFARLLLEDSPVILLDEPFAAVDDATTADLLALIGRWHGEGRTVIAALHDLAQVRAHFPETLLIARTAIAWGPTATVLTAANLDAARRMRERWDDGAAICRRTPP